MQGSSESVAALACALAKAQAQLVNPEKSLTATIRTGRAGEVEHTFRYAPLSNGLEIVRKTLSKHEIAVIQTTAIDQATSMLHLSTVLAHSSGEWISSQWPVCATADIANPHRMGAALTYARRYGLFTLVGIAGEDDTDAPEPCSSGPTMGMSGSDLHAVVNTNGNGTVRGGTKPAQPMLLSADQSTVLRDRLLSEIAALATHNGAIMWAKEALAHKNKLVAADAKTVEEAFEDKLSGLSPSAPEMGGTPTVDSAAGAGTVPRKNVTDHAAGPEPHLLRGKIDKAVLTIGMPRRYRNKDHLRFVAQQPCLLCGRKPSDPHHLRFVQPRALGRKASDEFAVPLCRVHHREVHRAKDERAWWQQARIEPLKAARKLWKETRVEEGHVEPAALRPSDEPAKPDNPAKPAAPKRAPI
jgi:hypothetical protein